MLGAVMLGHKGFQPVIDAIIQLAERAAKEPRDFQTADNSALESAVMRPRRGRPARRLRHHRQAGAPGQASTPPRPRCSPRCCGEGAESRARPSSSSASVFKELEAKIVRWNILDTGIRIDGRDVKTVRPIVCRGRRAAAHPRLGAVHPRRDAGAGRRHARHRRRRAVHRRAGGHLQGDASCCTTTSRPTRVGETGRMGSPGRREIGHGKLAWRAIRPMLPAAARVPLHDPRRLGDHRVERLVLDGDGLRRLAGADGCRRAAEARRSPASPWA